MSRHSIAISIGATPVPQVRLSDVGLRSILPPASGTIDYWDTTLPCFGLRVSRGGAKTFVLKLHNSRRAIGRFPILSLSEARTEAKRLLAEKTLGKIRPQSITYPQALALFLAEKEKARRPSTVRSLRDRLSRHFPFKGQLADISHQEFARRLAKIKTASEHNHALAAAKTFFTWTTNRRYTTENPTLGITPRSTQSRARVLSDLELQSIWRACEQRQAFDDTACPGFGSPIPDVVKFPRQFATIVQLLMLTGARRGEIASLQTSWINDHTITLPAAVTKNGREHMFPLTGLTLQLLSLPSQTTSLLFPARGQNDKPFNGWSKSKAALDKLSGVTGWTLHDLRRTYASKMAALGVAPHVIERLLNHVSGTISGVAAVYNRHRYEKECREAVERYERDIARIIA
jgi:integrase